MNLTLSEFNIDRQKTITCEKAAEIYWTPTEIWSEGTRAKGHHVNVSAEEDEDFQAGRCFTRKKQCFNARYQHGGRPQIQALNGNSVG